MPRTSEHASDRDLPAGRSWRTRRGRALALAVWVLAGLGVGAGSFAAAETRTPGAETAVLVLEPAASRVTFTLGATLHRVEGIVPMQRGELRFDPSGGPASGAIVLDARGIDTGSARRDRTMHETVLESARHPRIVFTPRRLEVVEREGRRAQVRLHGGISIHGDRHELTLEARVRAEPDDGSPLRLRAEGSLRVPYVAWGMKDPSTLLLRVDDEVEVRFDVVGRAEGLPLRDPAARSGASEASEVSGGLGVPGT